MAMLCAGIDPILIQMLGRWRSDAMLHYLTTQAEPVTAQIAARMRTNGNFTLLPNQDVPAVV
eukprot:scaffold312156_cov51-Attheya_sp.AAC.1